MGRVKRGKGKVNLPFYPFILFTGRHASLALPTIFPGLGEVMALTYDLAKILQEIFEVAGAVFPGKMRQAYRRRIFLAVHAHPAGQ